MLIFTIDIIITDIISNVIIIRIWRKKDNSFRLQKKELLELELEIKTLDLDAAKYDVELENEFRKISRDKFSWKSR